jgi:hypothetical protein
MYISRVPREEEEEEEEGQYYLATCIQLLCQCGIRVFL